MNVNKDIQKLVGQLKSAQARFQNIVKNKTWLEDARKYADQQKKEVKKLITGDFKRVKAFLVSEKSRLEKVQKKIPGEVSKFKVLFTRQRKEFERLLRAAGKVTGNGKRASNGMGTKRKVTRKKKASTAAPAATKTA